MASLNGIQVGTSASMVAAMYGAGRQDSGTGAWSWEDTDENILFYVNEGSGTDTYRSMYFYIPLITDPTISVRVETRVTENVSATVRLYMILEESDEEGAYSSVASDYQEVVMTGGDTGYEEDTLTVSPTHTIGNQKLYRLNFYVQSLANGNGGLNIWARVFGIKIEP